MGGKVPDTPDMCSDVMKDSLRDGNTVVGGGATAEFVEDDEGAGGSRGEDLFRFGEFDEEGGLGGEDIVVCAKTRHDAVDGGKTSGKSRDIAADLGHDDGDARL